MKDEDSCGEVSKKQIDAFIKNYGAIGFAYEEQEWMIRLGFFCCGWHEALNERGER